MSNAIWIVAIALGLLAAFAWIAFKRKAGPALPENLRIGRQLPDFTAVDDTGNVVGSRQLLGSPTILFFVRGRWCPFCTRQVEQLVGHYREMTALGAKLVFITPKPVETTRRVAEFFKVEFEYWLDDDLSAARQLGLLLPGGVPAGFEKEYGEDTMWPATFIVDSDGIIRFAKLSRLIVDRPDPKVLLRALRQLDK
jgi:peroxiredoxin